jgi:hypothetical protein
MVSLDTDRHSTAGAVERVKAKQKVEMPSPLYQMHTILLPYPTKNSNRQYYD